MIVAIGTLGWIAIIVGVELALAVFGLIGISRRWNWLIGDAPDDVEI
jgi:hypothetical protein